MKKDRRKKFLVLLMSCVAIGGVATTAAIITTIGQTGKDYPVEDAIYLDWGEKEVIESVTDLGGEPQYREFSIATPDVNPNYTSGGYSKVTFTLTPDAGSDLTGLKIDIAYDDLHLQSTSIAHTMVGSDVEVVHSEYVEVVTQKEPVTFYLRFTYEAEDGSTTTPGGVLDLGLSYAKVIE